MGRPDAGVSHGVGRRGPSQARREEGSVACAALPGCVLAGTGPGRPVTNPAVRAEGEVQHRCLASHQFFATRLYGKGLRGARQQLDLCQGLRVRLSTRPQTGMSLLPRTACRHGLGHHVPATGIVGAWALQHRARCNELCNAYCGVAEYLQVLYSSL